MKTILLETFVASGVVLYLPKEAVAYIKHRRKIKRDKRHTFDIVLPKVNDIYEEMAQSASILGAGRVIILNAHNGGGRPMVGSELKSSALYEIPLGLRSIKDSWKNQPLDQTYIEMLVELDRNEFVTLETGKMQESALRRLYFTDHILATGVMKITQDEKNFYYIAYNFDRPIDVNDAKVQETIRSAVNKIREAWV